MHEVAKGRASQITEILCNRPSLSGFYINNSYSEMFSSRIPPEGYIKIEDHLRTRRAVDFRTDEPDTAVRSIRADEIVIKIGHATAVEAVGGRVGGSRIAKLPVVFATEFGSPARREAAAVEGLQQQIDPAATAGNAYVVNTGPPGKGGTVIIAEHEVQRGVVIKRQIGPQGAILRKLCTCLAGTAFVSAQQLVGSPVKNVDLQTGGVLIVAEMHVYLQL